MGLLSIDGAAWHGIDWKLGDSARLGETACDVLAAVTDWRRVGSREAHSLRRVLPPALAIPAPILVLCLASLLQSCG